MRSRKRVRKQRGGRIPDSWDISTFLQDGAREAGAFEGEDDDEDYDYNYTTSEWFEANFEEVVANMMTEFSASREDIIQGLRTWYNNGSEGMDYYFGWIEEYLNHSNTNNNSVGNNNLSVNNVTAVRANAQNNRGSVHTGDPSNNENNPRGGSRRRKKMLKTRKIKKVKKI